MAKAIGQFSWRYEGKWHNADIMSIEEAEGDDLFVRYETDTIRGLMQPLIKLNTNRNRAYFLTDRSANGDIDFPEYQTAGCPAKIVIY